MKTLVAGSAVALLAFGSMAGVAAASTPTPRQVVRQYIGDINRTEWRAAWRLLDAREHQEMGTVAKLTSGLVGSNDDVTHLGPGRVTGATADVSLRMTTDQDDVVHRFSLMYHLVRSGHRWLIDNVSEVRPAVLVSSPPTLPPTTSTLPPPPSYTPETSPSTTTLPPPQTVQTPWGTALQLPYSPMPCTLDNVDDIYVSGNQAAQKDLGRNASPQELDQLTETLWNDEVTACEEADGIYTSNNNN